jgi:hypothetical protein
LNATPHPAENKQDCTFVPGETGRNQRVRRACGPTDGAHQLVCPFSAGDFVDALPRSVAPTQRRLAVIHRDVVDVAGRPLSKGVVFVATSPTRLTTTDISRHTRRHWGSGTLAQLLPAHNPDLMIMFSRTRFPGHRFGDRRVA